MGVEIERKYLVTSDAFKEGASGELYRQGYLNSAKERVVRIRIRGDAGFITIKGIAKGVERSEFEYAIPREEAAFMLENLCEQPIIEKTRYRLEFAAKIWEIDEFHGENTGLIVAEIELESADESFQRPPWLGEEVSADWRYYNSNLLLNPYSKWKTN